MYKSNYKETRYGLEVRLVNETDAEFIFKLRTNKELSQFITPVTGNISDQVNWIKKYKERENNGEEFYFIFSYKNERQGLARIYNIKSNHFTQGSWLFSPDAPTGCSILGNIISIELGFELPNKDFLYTDARIGNNTHKYVRSYHPEILDITKNDVFYKLSKENFNKYKKKHIELCLKVLAIQNKEEEL